MELCLGMDLELTESQWVRIKGQVTGDIIVGSVTGHLIRKNKLMRSSIDK